MDLSTYCFGTFNYRMTYCFIMFAVQVHYVFTFIMILQVESQEYSLDFWRRSLNSLTWIEILRQVLVASGFGSKQGSLRRDVLNKVFQSPNEPILHLT